MAMEVIHIPQKISSIGAKAGSIFLEVMLVPALLVASLGGAGQVTIGIFAVFLWRIVAAVIRWGLVGLIPATSLLTFGLLSARTGTAAASDTLGLGSTLQTYLIPACIVSFFAGAFFVITSFSRKPTSLKLAKDFVNVSEPAQEKLMPLFKAIDFIIGSLHVVSATVGAVVVFTTDERSAAVITSIVGVATPLSIFLLSVITAVVILKRSQLKLSFREQL